MKKWEYKTQKYKILEIQNTKYFLIYSNLHINSFFIFQLLLEHVKKNKQV